MSGLMVFFSGRFFLLGQISRPYGGRPTIHEIKLIFTLLFGPKIPIVQFHCLSYRLTSKRIDIDPLPARWQKAEEAIVRAPCYFLSDDSMLGEGTERKTKFFSDGEKTERNH